MLQAAILPLLERLNFKQTVVTVNKRLAVYLQEQYNFYQISQGHTVWQTPDIVAYPDWLTRCYQQALDLSLLAPELLLNTQQELSIWEQIIANSPQHKQLLQPHTAALEAQQAWQLLWEWQCPLADSSFSYSEDCSAFQTWAYQFSEYLKEQSWLDYSRLPERLSQLWQQHRNLLPDKIIWFGFIDLTSQQQKLCTLLHVQHYSQPNPSCGQLSRLACPDFKQELRTMARWAKQLAFQPNHRIGCIVPNLTAMRAEVIRNFSEIFAPETLLSPSESTLPFSISAGLSLTHYPLIYAALSIIQLNQPQISANTLLYLLRSPFLEKPSELFIHIRLQNYLRQYSGHTLSHDQLRQWLKSQTVTCQWLTNLAQLLNDCAGQASSHTPEAWAEIFAKQLKSLGWPGARPLTSEEYQLVQKWQDVLGDFASLAPVHPTLSLAKALQKLQRMAAMVQFQPKTASNNVAILSPLEAIGQHFSHLWIMGLHDGNWPPKPAPNAFLPLSLQRAYQMPHASVARETEFCEKLLTHFSQNSQEIIISYPQQDTEQLLRPSRQIIELPAIEVKDLSLAEDIQLAQQLHAKASLELVELDTAPPVSQTEAIRGGANLFKSLLACPFKAFAEYRLGAKVDEPLEVGLAATERGTLLHRCLELIWQELDSQQRLLTLSANQLQELIQRAITQAITGIQNQRQVILTRKIVQLETQRLIKLLQTWLDYEKQRNAFQVVAIEQQTQVTIGDIALNLKIDRIDQLASGEYIIIDYKTSQVQAKWESEQLTEPQLPLYCVSSSYPIAAVSLAQVRNDGVKFHGIGHTDGLLPQLKVHADWPGLLADWQQTLEKLATEFLAGNAQIAPRDKNTCNYCKLELVCRIKEKEN